MENFDPRTALIRSVVKLMQPLIRILLRNGIAYPEFADLAKEAYVNVAHGDFAVPGRKQSMTRVSVLTGIHRHEVGKLLKADSTESSHVSRHNRAARIIHGWLTDEEFIAKGKARVLSLESEFTTLVSRYGGDVTARSALDEMIRTGSVELNDESVTLLAPAFVPHDSLEDLMYLFGDCATDLLETLDHNLACDEDQNRLQMSVVYNNLPDDVLRNLELVSKDRAMQFLTELDKFYATQDKDTNPALEGEGSNRAGIGLYYFQTKKSEGDK